MTRSPISASHVAVALAPAWSDDLRGPFTAARAPCCGHFAADAPWFSSAALADTSRGVGGVGGVDPTGPPEDTLASLNPSTDRGGRARRGVSDARRRPRRRRN